jgi:hypothetical protein
LLSQRGSRLSSHFVHLQQIRQLIKLIKG